MSQRRTPVLIDVVLAVALCVLSVVSLTAGDAPGIDVGRLVLAVLAVAPVASRQLAPVASTLVIAAALTGWSWLEAGDWPSAGIGLVIAMFTVATMRSRRTAASTFALAVVVLLAAYPRTDGVTVALVAQALLVFVCAWALGEATRRWAQDAEDAAARAERAVADERTRIARDLHDVVAHHMSVVAVQAGLASYVLQDDPAAAGRAIAHADEAGREALQDMRRMLDALRPEDEPPSRAPQPGLADLDDLVARVQATGTEVTLTRRGRVPELAPGVQLCAYRIAQEALTNVLKHAGGDAAARVDVHCGPSSLVLAITDDGRGTPARVPPDGGHGLRGMRERAELYGGALTAGRGPDGGFRVRLELPLAAGGAGQAPEPLPSIGLA